MADQVINSIFAVGLICGITAFLILVGWIIVEILLRIGEFILWVFK